MAIETPTKIGLISNALVLLGETPLESLSDNRYGATVGANLFEVIYENELQSHNWRFATDKALLAQDVATPLNEWQYSYQLPATLLNVIGVYPPTNYEIYARKIFADASSVEIDYLFKPEVTALPAHFALLLTYALARDMVKPITESDQGVQVFEAKYIRQRDRALFADSQGRPNRAIVHSPFTQVR